MTEYSTSSEAIRDFRSTQERTAFWVDQYNQHGADHLLLSPSLPPSDIGDTDFQGGGSSESDTYSTHSIPPRMVLQFPDGRPDIPVSHGFQRPVRSRPRVNMPYNQHPAVIAPPPSSRHSRARAGSHPLPVGTTQANHSRSAQTLSYVTLPPGQAETPRPPVTPPRSPESIVILPSTDSEQSKHIVSRAITPPPGNGSHSRTPTAHHSSHAPRAPGGGSGATKNYSSHSNSPILSPSPRHAYSSSQHHTLPRNHSPGMMFSQSQPLPLSTSGGVRYMEQQAAAQAYPESKLAYNYSPPAIIYAPSSRARPQYAPPQIVYSPPMGSRGTAGRYLAPNMAHSQSVPPNQLGVYPPPGPIPPKQRSHHSKSHSQSSHPHENSSSHTQSLSRGRTRDMIPADQPLPHARSRSRRSDSRHRPRSPSHSLGGDSDDDDDDDGSVISSGTYYVLPTPGQKVQIIVGYLLFVLHEAFY